MLRFFKSVFVMQLCDARSVATQYLTTTSIVVTLYKCGDSCDSLDNLPDKLHVPGKTEDVKVFNITARFVDVV